MNVAIETLSVGDLKSRLADRADLGALTVYQTAEWFENFAATCLADHERDAVFQIPASPAPAYLPARLSQNRIGPLRRNRISSLSNFYSCVFAPIGLEATADGAKAIEAWARHVRNAWRPARIWFDATPEQICKAALKPGLAAAGYLVEAFPQFGNWYLSVNGMTFDAYWAARPSRLRNTVARKQKKLETDHEMQVVEFDAEHAEDAAETFLTAYSRSWQKDEPHPSFLPGLISYGLRNGEARMFALYAGGQPIAVQIWAGRSGDWTIYKLAYDQAYADYSPGSILTRLAIEKALQGPGVRELDFGWGDDAYKKDWLPERRERWGVAAYDPLTPTGLVLAVRNLVPKLFKR